MMELMVKGTLVAKNQDDNLVNLTSILRIAGLGDSETARLVKEDASLAERTIIDDGKYRGLWVKADAGARVARKLEIYDLVKPLFEDSLNTKTLARSFLAVTEPDTESSEAKRRKEETQENGKKKVEYEVPAASIAQFLPPLSTDIANYDQIKEACSQVLLSDTDSEAQCKALASLGHLEVPVDLHGNSILHWATLLPNLPLISQLVASGADPRRGNTAGETALIKAVSHINFYDSLSFLKLLDVLHPAIPILDARNRTILHHIVLLAGAEGRSDAAKYYLSCLVEWIIKQGPRVGITLQWFMQNLVNLQDLNGDTALNMVARIGNKAIAQQLLDVGADASLANKAGLSPEDFKLSGLKPKLQTSEPRNTKYIKESLANDGKLTGNETPVKLALESRKIMEEMQQTVADLSKFFESELKEKQTEIGQLHKELRTATAKLALARSHLETLKSSESRLNELRQKTANVTRCIEEEDAKFATICPDVPVEMGPFDPDQPFRSVELYEFVREKMEKGEPVVAQEILESRPELVAKLPPTYLLKARIRAYKENEEYLAGLARNLDEKSLALENKFRHVVSLCTGVEEAKVDDLLEGLVQAVESDPDEVDLGCVAGFLGKVAD